MKSILIMIAIFSLFSCNNEPKLTEQKTSNQIDNIRTPNQKISSQETFETKVVDTLSKLDFIHKKHLFIDSVTNHKHGIAFITDSLIDSNTDVFVRAGFNGEDRFETHYQFYINPSTMQIKVYDAIEDIQIPLVDYIKKTKQE